MKLIPENELPERKQYVYHDNIGSLRGELSPEIMRGYNQALHEVKSRARELDVEKVKVALMNIRDNGSRKPEYVFRNQFMPSSGTEKMYRQDKQLKSVAEALIQAINNGECWK